MKPATGIVKVFQIALVQVFIAYLLNFPIQVEGNGEEVGHCKFDSKLNGTRNLVLCYNLTSFPKNLEKYQNATLLGISVRGNNLQRIKNGSLLETGLPNLKSLWLIFAKIQQIEIGAFRGGDKVKYLNLRGNEITELNPNVFADLPKLEILVLGTNPLTGFTKGSEFPRLSNLRILTINSCRMRSIPTNLFKNLHNLETLDLSNSQLTTLQWNLFEHMQKLTQVSLDRNPFACDCRLTKALRYLHHKNIVWNAKGLISREPPSCISANTKIFISSLENVTWTCPAQICPKILQQEVGTDNFIGYWAVIIGGVLAVVASILMAILVVLKFQTRIKSAIKKFFERFQESKNGAKRNGMASIQQP